MIKEVSTKGKTVRDRHEDSCCCCHTELTCLPWFLFCLMIVASYNVLMTSYHTVRFVRQLILNMSASFSVSLPADFQWCRWGHSEGRSLQGGEWIIRWGTVHIVQYTAHMHSCRKWSAGLYSAIRVYVLICFLSWSLWVDYYSSRVLARKWKSLFLCFSHLHDKILDFNQCFNHSHIFIWIIFYMYSVTAQAMPH